MRGTTANTWQQVLKKVQGKVQPHSYETWFEPTCLLDEDDSSITVQVPNNWFAEWLTGNYAQRVEEALREVGRPGLTVVYRSASKALGEEPRLPPPEGAPTGMPAVVTRTPVQSPTQDNSSVWLNPKYTFESFVVSNCNEFAHAAASRVADSPGRNYNPLYIYGGVGLGKTHLMQAIGNRIKPAAKKMRYISSEQFMNELINAIRFEKTDDFRAKYRNVDVLMIDDIQFFAGKERTQEEFFHTFNALYDSQKQLVITSDVPPRDIPTLEERLRSRFEWGLITDIQPPDLETKVAILRKKASAEETDIPDDVAMYIATHSTHNIRELEGALIRVVAYASMSGRSIDLELAKHILQGFLKEDSAPSTVRAEDVERRVASQYGLKPSELKSKSNSPRFSFPRQIAMYLMKKLTRMSLPDIGRQFGGKHHTTVMHAINKIETKRVKDKEFDRQIDVLLRSLKRSA